MIRMEDFDEEYLKWKREEDLKGRLSGGLEGKNVMHVSEIKSCPLAIKDWKQVTLLPQVAIGVLLHYGVEAVFKRFPDVRVECPFRREVGEYVVIGTPDIVVGNEQIIDLKYTRWANKKKNEWDVIQLRLYKWLTGIEYAEIWKMAHNDWMIVPVEEPAYTDEEVIELIENRRKPMWDFECKSCKRENCPYRRDVR